MKRLNGWQRLWLLASAIYFFPVAFFAAMALTSGQTENKPLAVIMSIVLWVVPCVIVYILGLGIAWVMHGFRESGK